MRQARAAVSARTSCSCDLGRCAASWVDPHCAPERTPALRVTSRHTLFPLDEYDAAQPHANYDVSPDGKSFVMIHRAPTGRLTVIQNPPDLVRRLGGAQRR